MCSILNYWNNVMSEDKDFTIPFSNKVFFDLFKQYQSMPEQVKGLLDVQMKNIKSINQAQRVSMENFQEIASRQNEIFSQIMQQTTMMANDLSHDSSPENKLKRNALNFQKGYEQALSNVQEISELIKKSNATTSKILQDRANESIKEVKSCTSKKQA